MRQMLRLVLREAYFEVVEAQVAATASECLKPGSPALIVLEWLLPGMPRRAPDSGRTFCSLFSGGASYLVCVQDTPAQL